VTGSVGVFSLLDFHYQLMGEATVRRTGAVLDRVLRDW